MTGARADRILAERFADQDQPRAVLERHVDVENRQVEVERRVRREACRSSSGPKVSRHPVDEAERRCGATARRPWVVRSSQTCRGCRRCHPAATAGEGTAGAGSSASSASSRPLDRHARGRRVDGEHPRRRAERRQFRRERPRQALFRDDRLHGAVVHDVGAAWRRRLGVDRDVGGARFHDPEQRHHRVERLVEPERDTVAGPHAACHRRSRSRSDNVDSSRKSDCHRRERTRRPCLGTGRPNAPEGRSGPVVAFISGLSWRGRRSSTRSARRCSSTVDRLPASRSLASSSILKCSSRNVTSFSVDSESRMPLSLSSVSSVRFLGILARQEVLENELLHDGTCVVHEQALQCGNQRSDEVAEVGDGRPGDSSAVSFS